MVVERFRSLLTAARGRQAYRQDLDTMAAQRERFRDEWQPHLDNSKALIGEAITATAAGNHGRDGAAGHGGGKAVVLGSGLLLDIPLEDLAGAFAQVVLVDMVQAPSVKGAVRGFPNVRLVQGDVTGIVDATLDAARRGTPLPDPAPPPLADDADLVVSANMLSQLPVRPHAFLTHYAHHPKAEIDTFVRHLVSSHLKWLSSLPGVVCLIADMERIHWNGRAVTKRTDLLYGAKPPTGGRKWEWNIDPRNENHPDHDIRHRVRGKIFPRPRK